MYDWCLVQTKDAEAVKFIILLALIFFGMIAQFAVDWDPSEEELSWAMIIPEDWRDIQKTHNKKSF